MGGGQAGAYGGLALSCCIGSGQRLLLRAGCAGCRGSFVGDAAGGTVAHRRVIARCCLCSWLRVSRRVTTSAFRYGHDDCCTKPRSGLLCVSSFCPLALTRMRMCSEVACPHTTCPILASPLLNPLPSKLLIPHSGCPDITKLT